MGTRQESANSVCSTQLGSALADEKAARTNPNAIGTILTIEHSSSSHPMVDVGRVLCIIGQGEIGRVPADVAGDTTDDAKMSLQIGFGRGKTAFPLALR
jgi:hypothetical protein